MICPCGSLIGYENCCKPLHQGIEVAETALRLMQSRYCAYVVKAFEYLKNTTDPQTTVNFNHEANIQWGRQVQFQRLEILRSEENHNRAQVEFKAFFFDDQKNQIHHEISQFRRLEGIWYYSDGEVKST